MVLRDKVTVISEQAKSPLEGVSYAVEHLSNVLVSPIRRGQRKGNDGATANNTATLYYFPERSVTDSPTGVPYLVIGMRVVKGHIPASKVDTSEAWTIQSVDEYFDTHNGKPHHMEVQLV